MRNLRLMISLVAILIASASGAFVVSAAGNINLSSKYSQFLNTDLDSNSRNDLINWAPTYGGATVATTTITGYIWGETMGWINLNPTNGGVTNTCDGILGGYAWGQNTGWINFAPTYATGANQPKINTTTGAITGTVWSQNFGWIKLNSSDGTYPGLTTSWTGCSSPTATTTVTTVGGPGPGPTPPPIPPVPPPVPPVPPTVPPPIPPIPPIPPVPPAPPSPTPTPSPSSPSSASQKPPESWFLGQDLVLTFKNRIANIVNNKVVQQIAEALADSLPIIAPVVGVVGVFSTIPGIATRIMNLAISFLLSRKKTRGVVYDAATKEPLDPVYVSVFNAITGQEIMNAITDMEGRFGFVLKQGSYRMVAQKTNYAFPAASLLGKTEDGIYKHLYFGEVFPVVADDQVITVNIPMDSTGTDWNQVEKRRMNIFKYFIEKQGVFAKLINVLFVLGLFISSISVVLFTSTLNYALAGFYVVVGMARLLGYGGPVTPGKITYQGKPLAHALVKIFNANLNREVSHKVTNESGSYYALVPKAEYYVTIETKNPDGTYTQIFKSDILRAKHGMINSSFTL